MLVLRLCRFKSLIICLRMVAGDPDALVKVAGRNDSALEGWAENEHLQLLNLTYVFLSESLPLEICNCMADYHTCTMLLEVSSIVTLTFLLVILLPFQYV